MALVARDHGDKYMPFAFNRRKSIQAVALLLKTRPKSQDSYMRLLKILYIADRESIKETGVPITGDTFVAMEHGTMLSRLLNLAKRTKGHLDRKPDHIEWDQYISPEPDYEIRLTQDPGDGLLCDYEMNKLREVAKRYKDKGPFDMKEVTHELPEYHDPGKGKQQWIPLREVLNAIGLAGVADQIEEEARASASVSRLLGR
jgi:uncharacterized phage-associated protein